MKKVVLFSLMLVCFVGYSQKEEKNTNKYSDVIIDGPDDSDEKPNDPNYIYTAVETMPQYSDGGIDGFRKFIAQNYRTPKIDVDLKGTLIIAFVVEQDGSLTDIKVIRDLGYGTGAEAIRVLKKSKKWIPGVQNNRPVRVKYTLPLNINIQGKPPVIKSEE